MAMSLDLVQVALKILILAGYLVPILPPDGIPIISVLVSTKYLTWTRILDLYFYISMLRPLKDILPEIFNKFEGFNAQ